MPEPVDQLCDVNLPPIEIDAVDDTGIHLEDGYALSYRDLENILLELRQLAVRCSFIPAMFRAP